MKIILTYLLIVLGLQSETIIEKNSSISFNIDQYISDKFEKIDHKELQYDCFKQAYKGFLYLKVKGELHNTDYLTIIDFSKPSNEKRLFLVDTKSMAVIKHTYCSHGKNTGGLYAKHFSNKEGSLKSSLGFYITDYTYKGKFDLALKLEGIEPFNSNARKRAIVMHGAEYATESFLKKNNGILGRSWGCPAVPVDEAEYIISRVKDGSCMFIYKGEKGYQRNSRILNAEIVGL